MRRLLVSLLEADEYAALGIVGLADAADEAGISVLHLPIPDGSEPATMERCRATVAAVVTALAADRTVVVHCRGGLGRSGLLAACCLTACGAEPDVAIRCVREAPLKRWRKSGSSHDSRKLVGPSLHCAASRLFVGMTVQERTRNAVVNAACLTRG
jgi:Cyclin-dependent kinase inhibitor 3 (CDKN3)